MRQTEQTTASHFADRPERVAAADRRSGEGGPAGLSLRIGRIALRDGRTAAEEPRPERDAIRVAISNIE